jgi:transposase
MASCEGMSARQAAARFGVGVSSAIRWIARARIGELAPRPQGRRRASSLDAHEVFIVGMIEECKDITLNEMVERLVAERLLQISRSALSAWLRGHGWTYKKRMARPAARVMLSGVHGLHQRIRSQVLSWPRWVPRGSGLIKSTALSATFLTRLPRRRFDRCAISPSPSQIAWALLQPPYLVPSLIRG